MDITGSSPLLSVGVALKHTCGVHLAIDIAFLAVTGLDGIAWDSVVEHTQVDNDEHRCWPYSCPRGFKDKPRATCALRI